MKILNAELEKVYGGARAIATMTFDDGLRETAKAINALCKKYACRASLMLCSGIRIDTTLDMWQGLFAEGYLHPECHSHLHKYLTRSHPENLTEEVMCEEIEGSLDRLNKLLPGYDILTFAIPYSSYAEEAREHLYKSFYAVRGGNCVLADERVRGKMQTLNPTLKREQIGSWYNMIGIRMMPEKSHVYPMINCESIIAYLDTCVCDGGWFISVAHGVLEGENLDIKLCELERIMQRIAEYIERGELWVTTFTDATKYIRERQNTAVIQKNEPNGDISLELKMADITQDGLPLTPTVFNLPLTVRLEFDGTPTNVKYTMNGKDAFAPVLYDNGRAYVRINMCPGSKISVALK